MDWARILAYITGTVVQERLSRNEYLVTENGILKRQIKGRLLLSESERATLGEIGHWLGRRLVSELPLRVNGGAKRDHLAAAGLSP